MEALPLLLLVGGALVGAVAGAAACYLPLSRVIAELRARLERAEHARNGAVERSAQAREQIAQLNRSITELRRVHSAQSKPEAARAPSETADKAERARLVAKALAEGDEKTLLLPREPAKAFADTQLMSPNSIPPGAGR